MSNAQENPDVPSGEVKDNTYVTQSVMDGSVPVVKDDNVKDPIDPKTADSDETLGMNHLYAAVCMLVISADISGVYRSRR